ncbi:MAG: phosphatase PAP2 family protein [Candidatus Hodarchaeales archaeon]
MRNEEKIAYQMNISKRAYGGVTISDLIFGDRGLDFLKDLQDWSPELDLFFKLITLFGETAIIIAIVATIYWAVNKRFAIGLTFALAIGGYLNTFFKGVMGIERPFQSHGQEVKEIGTAEGYSFPSGHSEVTGAFWTYSSLEAKESSVLAPMTKYLIFGASIVFIILVPLSRAYLGVHWPGDAFIGVIEGILIAVVLFWGMPRAWLYLEKMSDREQGIAIVGATLLMACASTLATSFFGNDVMTAANWELPGALSGLAIGLILEKHYVGFEIPSVNQKGKIAFRLILGLLLLVAVYYGLKIIVSPFEDIELLSDIPETTLMLPLDYIRLFLVGLTVAFGIPWCFIKLEKKLGMQEGSNDRERPKTRM